MPSHSQIVVHKYGFKSIWEIDEQMLDDSGNRIVTKLETVEGMPGVKWSLECDNNFPVDFLLYVESKEEIEYSLEHKFLSSSFPTEKSENIVQGKKKYILSRIDERFLKHFVKNGKIKFEIEANFLYKQKLFNDFNVCDATEWGLRLKQSTSTDFDILVDGQTIGIHKFMVTAESPVLAKMFESNFKEAKEKKVTITDFKKEIVQAAIDYCYRQDITVFLKDHQKSMDLLRFCDKYDFQTLKPKLEKFIISTLSKENVFYIASKAEAANSLDIRQACINFIRLNVASSWTNVDISEIDGAFFKNIIAETLNMKNGT